MKQKFITILILLFPLISLSQKIEGFIKSKNGDLINNSSILFFEENNSSRAKEFLIVNNGFYSVELKKKYHNLLIKIKANGYLVEEKLIKNIKNINIYQIDFELKKDTLNELGEVIVVAKKKPFKIKKDTISFNVESYKDGSERKIGEIIKKLPGVEMDDESGEIKYKGKSIEAVTLDGDDLFGFNYSLGTKNINVDIVEQIEAIENYSKNPLLKDIQHGGKVSLNLKLKKRKFDFSGDLETSSGIFNKGNFAGGFGGNLLAVKKTYKSFLNIIHNNVGVNNSPFDYSEFNLNVEQLLEQNFLASKVIPESRISNLLDNDRSNINNQLFSNYNAIFKINPRLNIKTNLYYLNDKITINDHFENQYVINNNSFLASDNTFTTRKPNYYRGDLDLKFNASKKSLLEYKFKIKKEKIKTLKEITQNQLVSLNSNLESEDTYLIQDLLWTKKITNKKALQLSAFNSISNASQKLKVFPSTNVENYNSDNLQKSEFTKNYFNLKATLLGSSKKNKYSFVLGYNVDINPFTSKLIDNDNFSIISQNNFKHSKNSIYQISAYNFNLRKWQFSPSFTLSIVNQKLNNYLTNSNKTNSNIILSPTFKIKYRINGASFVTGLVSYNEKTNSEEYFFRNKILIDNRTTLKNSPDLELRSNENYSLFYYYNDLFKQFQLNFRINYRRKNGSYLSNSFITENNTEVEYVFLPEKSQDLITGFQISKYIDFLESTLRLNTDFSLSNYNNIVNNSTLRNNKSKFAITQLFWKTALSFPLNFENTLILRKSISESENQQKFTNNGLHNNFKILIKLNEKWFFTISSDYYVPNKNSKNKYMFIDAIARIRPKNKNWECNLIIRNLTNENEFEQVQTSDISKSLYRSNLLSRYFLLNVLWNL